MSEQVEKRLFEHDDFSYTITAIPENNDPLTLRFRVDKVSCSDPTDVATFAFVGTWNQWPYGIQFIETDELIHNQFNMIENAVKTKGDQLFQDS